jgi:hypothetical protein
MPADKKILWLKRILVAKIILILFVWGLPSLLFPLSLLQRFGVPIPDASIYLRLMGAVITAFAVAYWFAYQDPVRNTAILKAGIVDNGLSTLVTLYYIVFQDLRSTMMMVSALLTLFFFISFLLLIPKAEAA